MSRIESSFESVELGSLRFLKANVKRREGTYSRVRHMYFSKHRTHHCTCELGNYVVRVFKLPPCKATEACRPKPTTELVCRKKRWYQPQILSVHPEILNESLSCRNSICVGKVTTMCYEEEGNLSSRACKFREQSHRELR